MWFKLLEILLAILRKCRHILSASIHILRLRTIPVKPLSFGGRWWLSLILVMAIVMSSIAMSIANKTAVSVRLDKLILVVIHHIEIVTGWHYEAIAVALVRGSTSFFILAEAQLDLLHLIR